MSNNLQRTEIPWINLKECNGFLFLLKLLHKNFFVSFTANISDKDPCPINYGCCSEDINYHFFCFYQKDKSSDSKVSSDRLIITAKGSLKLPNLYMLIKLKSPLLHRNLALRTFGKLLIVFSTKVNLPYLLYSTAQRCCLLHVIKQKCLLKTFQQTDWKSLVFQIARRFHQWFLYLKMLGTGLQLKTTTLLVCFLWLVKSLKNL